MTGRSSDLSLVAVASVAAALVLIGGPFFAVVGIIAATPLVLILPGYAMARAAFAHPLRPAQYLMLSIALSICVAILSGLVLHLALPVSRPLASPFWPVLLSGFTVVCCTVAHRRGHPAPPPLTGWPRPRARDLASLAAAVVILTVAGVLSRTPLAPPANVTGYTQLWLLPGADEIRLGVASHELRSVDYRLELNTRGATTVEGPARVWRLRLGAGEACSMRLPHDSLEGSGRMLEARLYLGDSARPHRRVRVQPLDTSGSSEEPTYERPQTDTPCAARAERDDDTTVPPLTRSRHRQAGLRDIRDYAPQIALDLRYATARNLTGGPLPGYCRPWPLLQRRAAQDVARADRYLARRGLGLRVLDAYRPARASRALVRWALRNGQAERVGSTFVRRSLHNSGWAVDVTLVRRRDGRALPMGGGYYAHSGAQTSDARGAVLRNRLLLKAAMERHGFLGYEGEWWHFYHHRLRERHLDITLGCG